MSKRLLKGKGKSMGAQREEENQENQIMTEMS